MWGEGGRSRSGPRCVLASRILLSPTRPRMQGILRLVFSNATAYSVLSRHVVLVSFLSRLVLVSSCFCDSPSAVFISRRFFFSPRACLVSLLSHHHFLSSRVCLVWSRGLGLLDSWSLGLLVSDILVCRSVVTWSLDLLISWSLVSWLLGPVFCSLALLVDWSCCLGATLGLWSLALVADWSCSLRN